ncbi:hypothetical protein FJZ36_10380 [Candidatus Poribacteria bacterium]|nr:hypothetical protein [Candidatus Poribacteria bacterium]
MTNQTHENVVKNRLKAEDEPIHGWYRFVLGYPPHLVREYLEAFEAEPDRDLVYDPFCGTATTPVEARLCGFRTLSSDANPVALLAARAKLNWDIDTSKVRMRLDDVLAHASATLARRALKSRPGVDATQLRLLELPASYVAEAAPPGARDAFDPSAYLPPDAARLIPAGFISPKPLLRVLAVRHAIDNVVCERELADLMLLALANTIVSSAGNIGFGPEIYRTRAKEDVDVLGDFSDTVERMAMDLQVIQQRHPSPHPTASVRMCDARVLDGIADDPPIGAVITSPPYPNEKDYTRSTRLENVLLGYLTDRAGLRTMKSMLLRSNTRNTFIKDDDDRYIRDIQPITKVADEIEKRRIELGKTSGFERLYHRVALLYFGGMYRHLEALRQRLRSGARCAYVVGDQASFFRVPIRTAELLADVAMKAGYRVDGIQLWRTRRATATRDHLDENVLLLRRR